MARDPRDIYGRFLDEMCRKMTEETDRQMMNLLGKPELHIDGKPVPGVFGITFVQERGVRPGGFCDQYGRPLDMKTLERACWSTLGIDWNGEVPGG